MWWEMLPNIGTMDRMIPLRVFPWAWREWFWNFWIRSGLENWHIWDWHTGTRSSWYLTRHMAWKPRVAPCCCRRRPRVWCAPPRVLRWPRGIDYWIHKKRHWGIFRLALVAWVRIAWSWWVPAYIPRSNNWLATPRNRAWIWRIVWRILDWMCVGIFESSTCPNRIRAAALYEKSLHWCSRTPVPPGEVAFDWRCALHGWWRWVRCQRRKSPRKRNDFSTHATQQTYIVPSSLSLVGGAGVVALNSLFAWRAMFMFIGVRVRRIDSIQRNVVRIVVWFENRWQSNDRRHRGYSTHDRSGVECLFVCVFLVLSSPGSR